MVKSTQNESVVGGKEVLALPFFGFWRWGLLPILTILPDTADLPFLTNILLSDGLPALGTIKLVAATLPSRRQLARRNR